MHQTRHYLNNVFFRTKFLMLPSLPGIERERKKPRNIFDNHIPQKEKNTQ